MILKIHEMFSYFLYFFVLLLFFLFFCYIFFSNHSLILTFPLFLFSLSFYLYLFPFFFIYTSFLLHHAPYFKNNLFVISTAYRVEDGINLELIYRKSCNSTLGTCMPDWTRMKKGGVYVGFYQSIFRKETLFFLFFN